MDCKSFSKNIIKIVLIGSYSGKTCLRKQFTDGEFPQDVPQGTFLECSTKKIVSLTQSIVLHIFDTGGIEGTWGLAQHTCCDADVIVMVYDITDERSFSFVRKKYEELLLETYRFATPLFALVGNKIDRGHDRQVDQSTAKRFAFERDMMYFETSALTGEGVEEMFLQIAETCFMNRHHLIHHDSSHKYTLPILDESCLDDFPLCDIDPSRVESTEGYSQSKLVKFFQGKTSLSLTPNLGDVNLRIPFKAPHIISHFYISSQNIPSSIKRFKMHFTTVDKKLYVKEFSVSSDIPFDHYFWEKFIVEISVPIIACYLEVLSPDGDDKQPKVHLHAIRFVIDKEMEKQKAEEKRFKIEKLRVEGEARRTAEVKEERRVEINELLSDFISSTKQTLSALRDDLDATKKELSHTKAELEAEKTLRIQENEEFEKQLELKQAQMDSLSRELSMHQQTSETKRLILSRDIRSLQRELACVSARVSGQPPELCASVTKNHADTVSRRVSVLSPLSEYVSVSCDVDTMSSTLMTSVPCSLWHNALSDDGTLSHNAMMMLGLVSLFRALHDGCDDALRDDALRDDALSDGHLHDTDMNNGLRKCTMHESIRQVTCKMSDV
ncbi:Small GTPase like protein, partial [Aduncisulcus paluster]